MQDEVLVLQKPLVLHHMLHLYLAWPPDGIEHFLQWVLLLAGVEKQIGSISKAISFIDIISYEALIG